MRFGTRYVLAILIAPPHFAAGISFAELRPETAENGISGAAAERASSGDQISAIDSRTGVAAPSSAAQLTPLALVSAPAILSNLVPLDVSLSLNERFLGTISVAVDAKGDGELDARRLIELLQPAVPAKTLSDLKLKIAGKSRISFSEVAGESLIILFDPFKLEVAVTLPRDAINPTSVRVVERDVVPNPNNFDKAADFSAGVNFSATQRYVHSHDVGFEPLSVDMDALMNIGGFDGVTITGGMRYDGSNDDQQWERREVRATRDFFGSAIRATAGEFTPSSVAFQGSSRILGIGIERAYSTIRPFQNVRPIGRRDFEIDRESSVDVYVNDIRVRSIRLPAGRYDISDFPFGSGPNNVRLVVDNVGGRQEILDFNIFSGAELLTPGITEFGAAIGLRESDVRLHYRSPAATAYAYHGFSDNMTLGLNGQATNLGLQAGGAVLWGSRIGFVQMEASASHSLKDHRLGYALSLDYRGEFSILASRDLRLSVTSLYRSRNFQDAFTFDIRNLQALQSAALAQWRAPFGISMGLGYGHTKMRESRRDIHRLDANLGRTFGRFSLNTNGSRVADDRGIEWRITLGLSMRLGHSWYGDYRFDSGANRHELEISRSSEGKLNEISGNVRLTTEHDGRALAGRLAYINNRFDMVLNHNRIESRAPDGVNSTVSDWHIRTFLGYADGSVALGRTVNDGFIIAPLHSTLKGSQLLLQSGDRVVAKSGFFGPALVPVNRAYGINRYEVKVDPLPVGYDIGSGIINTFPGYGSGYRAVIGSASSRIVTGYLIGPFGSLPLIGGTVVALDNDQQLERPFFTNRSGRFVADRLSPGRYQLRVENAPIGEFIVPKEQEGLIDVGIINIQ
jgi:outer membrane usher protein